MTQSYRAGMIGAARSLRRGAVGEAATVVTRGLVDEEAGRFPATRRAPQRGLFDGLMSDFQDAFDSFSYFNPFTIAEPPSPVRARGSFTELRFAGPIGARSYKLYRPACAEDGTALPLVVMLHGCAQTADDFALGTRMNHWAERDGFLVCYPEQSSAANGQRCWNWFLDEDQRRGRGEPALVAGITRDVMARHPVDRDRVYVAGLSAGGALAATMGRRYPDLYAAVGVHSGLACGAAHDTTSAFAAMRAGAGDSLRLADAEPASAPVIVFHGDRDATVNAVNAAEVVAQATRDVPVETSVEDGTAPGGRAYRRTRYLDAAGLPRAERWIVSGSGHAWSGGDVSASYTDPQGPDASGEMLRFFAEHVGIRATAG